MSKFAINDNPINCISMEHRPVHYTFIFLLGLLSLAFWTCTTENRPKEDPVGVLLDSIKHRFAPDKRVALFEVEAQRSGAGLTLKGVTNLPAALEAFKEGMEAQKLEFKDSIELLPSATLGEKIHGVVKISVANIRSRPGHSAELVTQATLGTPVKIYQKRGSWYRIQTPDKYLGWMDNGGLEPMDKIQMYRWLDSDKLIYTQTYGKSYIRPDAQSQTVSDLVIGNMVQWVGESGPYYEVGYPDGRKAFVPKAEAVPYTEWLAKLPFTEEALVATSKTLMGVPYLWGGTSAKGMDCSGFTKTVFFMNGMVLPRDASQQIHEGLLVDDAKDFDKLAPGDLLFFGKKATDSTPERVIHVGIWIGNKEFIHAAGDVHISSMDPASERWDAYNHDRYLRTKRILNQKDEGLLYLTENDIF